MNEDSLKRSTEYQDNDGLFSGFLRLGFVTEADNEKRIAKVRFEDLDCESDWIPVLINRDFIPDYDVSQRTEYKAGGSLAEAYELHMHELTIRPWMPKPGEQVLCIYEPVRGGRGYVLGGIQSWQ